MIHVTKTVEIRSVQAFGSCALTRRVDEEIYRLDQFRFNHEPVTGMRPEQVREIIVGLQELLRSFGDLPEETR